MTDYEQANVDLLAKIQLLRADLGYEHVSSETISTMALFDGLCKVERELRRELSWQGATTKPQAALPKDAITHGVNCQKAPHCAATGYLHTEADDSPYDVDGVAYCGRCHMVTR